MINVWLFQTLYSLSHIWNGVGILQYQIKTWVKYDGKIDKEGEVTVSGLVRVITQIAFFVEQIAEGVSVETRFNYCVRILAERNIQDLSSVAHLETERTAFPWFVT